MKSKKMKIAYQITFAHPLADLGQFGDFCIFQIDNIPDDYPDNYLFRDVNQTVIYNVAIHDKNFRVDFSEVGAGKSILSAHQKKCVEIEVNSK